MARHRRDISPMSSINLTSLLDITFVLLIAFMLVAPALNHGLELELQEVEGAAAISTQKPIMISITNRKDPKDQPHVYLDGRRKNFIELKKMLEDIKARRQNPGVIIQCDKREESGVLLRVIGLVRDVGIENIGLETEPE